MTETTLTQKEQAYAFAKEYGFTIGLETVARRTRYWATRGDKGVEALGYASLLVRMRKHAEGLKLLPVQTFSKTQSRGAQKAAEVRDMPKITPVALNWKAPVLEPITPEEAIERVAKWREDNPDVIKTWEVSKGSLAPRHKAALQWHGRPYGQSPGQSSGVENLPKIARPWAVFAQGGAEFIESFCNRQEAVRCVRKFMSDNRLIRATVEPMSIVYRGPHV